MVRQLLVGSSNSRCWTICARMRRQWCRRYIWMVRLCFSFAPSSLYIFWRDREWLDSYLRPHFSSESVQNRFSFSKAIFFGYKWKEKQLEPRGKAIPIEPCMRSSTISSRGITTTVSCSPWFIPILDRRSAHLFHSLNECVISTSVFCTRIPLSSMMIFSGWFFNFSNFDELHSRFTISFNDSFFHQPSLLMSQSSASKDRHN